ncbi:MAG: peptidylprolyl isomerase [Planctomycetes bacterium]|nr:peptidylprolyl isomerase [Planctomycetota bacterium]
MKEYSAPYIKVYLLLAVVSCLLFACKTTSDSKTFARPLGISAPEPVQNRRLPLGTEPVATFIDARPVAIINGHVLEWGELRPLLNEAAGATVLQEVILDRMTYRALAKAGKFISQDDIQRELKLFHDSLSLDPDTALRLSSEVRARQGLGPIRFKHLLRRNATLRALVSNEVKVNESSIRRTFEVLYGPRRQARLIMLPSLRSAQEAVSRIRSGESFSDIAVEISTDVSAARGGLLEPISRGDLSYPQALRDALWDLGPMGLSAPILMENGYALLLFEKQFDGTDVDIEEVRPELQRIARIDRERLLMDQLARQMLFQASVTIYDKELNDNWRRSRFIQ